MRLLPAPHSPEPALRHVLLKQGLVIECSICTTRTCFFLGIISVLFIILNLLVCLLGILVGVLGFLVGVLSFLFGVYGILCVIFSE